MYSPSRWADPRLPMPLPPSLKILLGLFSPKIRKDRNRDAQRPLKSANDGQHRGQNREYLKTAYSPEQIIIAIHRLQILVQ